MFFLKLSWHLLQVKGIPSILTISANIENYFSKAFFSTYQNVVLFFRSNSTSDQRWCHSYSGHALCSTDMPRAQYDNAGETEKFAHRWCYPLPRVDAKNLRFIIKWWTSVQNLDENLLTMGKRKLEQLLAAEHANHQFLLQIILAADYLQMEKFLLISTHLMADALNECESVEEIRRKFFGIKCKIIDD